MTSLNPPPRLIHKALKFRVIPDWIKILNRAASFSQSLYSAQVRSLHTLLQHVDNESIAGKSPPTHVIFIAKLQPS